MPSLGTSPTGQTRNENPGIAACPARTRGQPGVRRTRLAVAGLVLLTLAAYFPALRGGFVWDDYDNIVRNPTKLDVSGLARTWRDPFSNQQYYPLTHTVLWLEYQLWGERTTGYHVLGVLLHAANAILLWRLLAVLSVPGALLAACVFALHPVAVESVAWISELKNTLSGIFALGCALLFSRWLCSGDRGGAGDGGGRPRAADLPASLALFACALASKTTTSVLPAVLLLIAWWKRGRLGRVEILALSPFFLLGAAGAAVLAWIERFHVGSSGSDFQWSFAERVIIAGRALWWYAGKLAWPTDLVFIPVRWGVDPGQPSSYLWPVAAAALLGGLWLARRRLGAGPLVGALAFVIMLLPALGFVSFFFMRYSFVQDHFQYLAAPGLIALAAAGGATALRPAGAGRPLASAAARGGATLLLTALWLLTWRQAGLYRDEETIWRSTIAKNPASALAHNNLGVIHVERGDRAAAVLEYREALRLEPGDCEATANLAVVLLDEDGGDEGKKLLEDVLRRCGRNAVVLFNLGVHAQRLGRFAEAESHYREALRLDPSHEDARINLAAVLKQSGR